jgi:hypothetical protein
VAVVRYTFTHKQYTEYKERYITLKKWEVLAVPRLCELYPDICLTTAKKVRKNLRVVEKCPDIPVAVVQYTFTHKYKEHNETEYTERYIFNNKNVCIYRTGPIRTYRNRKCSLITRAKMVLETFVYLMWLLAREYLIEFGSSGSFKLCNVRLVKDIIITNLRFLNLWAASTRFRKF